MPQRPEILDPPSQLTADWPLPEWDNIHVLAAVSGGADSVALVRALLAAKRASTNPGPGRIFAAHVNHQLRGAESDADETWLCGECQRWNIPLLVRRADPATFRPTNGDGGEAGLRTERYRLLTDMAEKLGARVVVTAHTQDDQAETVLFRLLRGSGLRGLAGVQRSRPLSPSVTLMRPWLACSRDDLRGWLEKIGQSWREDATNATSAFARNRVRNELLPYLREHFNVEVDAAVLRVAEQASEAQQLVESLAERLLAACDASATADGVSLNVAPLADQPPLLAVEALRLAWRTAAWPEQAMTHRWWRDLAALAQDAGNARSLILPGDVLARREGPRLVLARPARPG